MSFSIGAVQQFPFCLGEASPPLASERDNVPLSLSRQLELAQPLELELGPVKRRRVG